ncbi:hypothetical protein AWB71_05338 [Caballeronia peredens]|nr:hypothetical protein AWB71_05338 [Caballeronia peredens]
MSKLIINFVGNITTIDINEPTSSKKKKAKTKPVSYSSHNYIGETCVFFREVDVWPLPGFTYNFIEAYDEYHSLIRGSEVASVIKQLNAGRPVGWSLPYHLSDDESHLEIVRTAIKNGSLRLNAEFPYFLEGLGLQRFSLKNHKVADLLLELTFQAGATPAQVLREWSHRGFLEDNAQDAAKWVADTYKRLLKNFSIRFAA